MDRNATRSRHYPMGRQSLSVRRAWIEIFYFADKDCDWVVALRKESVDRNITRGQLPTPEPPSLSVRRAWIEISVAQTHVYAAGVALRKESVDRNVAMPVGASSMLCRSP